MQKTHETAYTHTRTLPFSFSSIYYVYTCCSSPRGVRDFATQLRGSCGLRERHSEKLVARNEPKAVEANRGKAERASYYKTAAMAGVSLRVRTYVGAQSARALTALLRHVRRPSLENHWHMM